MNGNNAINNVADLEIKIKPDCKKQKYNNK